MIRKEIIPELRKEAEETAKQILGNETKLGNNFLDAKHNTVKKFKSGMHSFLNQNDVDYLLNNNMDIVYLYDEMASKYNGNVDKSSKKNYKPSGNKRGRPKQDNNEQEQ